MANQQSIIIKRKKGGGHAGHHGGAWKVAYADFTTAMMSFFLLMWLLNTTTSDQRAAIAEYFAPTSISSSHSGAGGLFGGMTLGADGAKIGNGAEPAVDEAMVPTAGKGEEGDEDVSGKNKLTGDKKTKTNEDGSGSGNGKTGGTEAAIEREEKSFKQTESLLRDAIKQSPELREFSNQILIDRTAEGLRIQLVDQFKYSMFPSASALLYEQARNLIQTIGMIIARLPNHISITGHTDNAPFLVGSRNDNWSLSTERANASRVEMVRAGVAEERIDKVVGLADRDPLIPESPRDPRNRRISIVLLRQTRQSSERPTPLMPPPAESAAPEAAKPAAAPSTAPASPKSP